jgi:phosphoribosylamine--glycine ligase
MSRFLFVSYDGLIADAAWQVVKEGHDVQLHISNVEEQGIAEGFVPRSADWRADAERADVIVFDDVLGHGTLADELRRAGKRVVGGTPYTDKLETIAPSGRTSSRPRACRSSRRPTSRRSTTRSRSSKTTRTATSIKPSGEAQNYKRLLFVGEEEDGRDVIQVLEDYQRAWAGKIREFQLQRRIMGVEVATGAFFNGRAFVPPVCVNFEHKKLFPGDIGPSTGEMGTAMFWSEPNKIFNATLKKMEPKLAEERYVGYIDINCIVNGNGIYPLEFTARFGYPTISIQQEGLLTPLGEMFLKLAEGSIDRLRSRSGFQVGVRIVVPPFPFNDPETFEGSSRDAVILFKTPSRDGFHIEDVKTVNGEWLVTGTSGVVLIVCGTGASMKQAQRQAYNRVRNVMIPNMYYREDIGDRWLEEDSDRLHSWGYLRE